MGEISASLQQFLQWLLPAQQFTAPVWWTLAWLAFGKLALGFGWEAITRVAPVREHRVFRIGTDSGQRRREILSSWHVFSDAIFLYALLRLQLIQLASGSWASALLTFAVFYVWVEVLYYFTHRWMHEHDFLYRLHRSHHLSRVVTPLSSISMSWIEKWVFYTAGWLSFMAAVSWLVPVSLAGIAAYYAFHFIISLHGHSNVETSRLGALLSNHLSMGSATSHALHHARFKVNYGFSCMLLDKLFGTYSADTGLLQRRAIERRGVEAFGQIRDLRRDAGQQTATAAESMPS